MDKKNEFMRRAIELSEESVRTGGGPFGAVIVRGDEIIAEASNSVTIDNDPTAHAEVNCIRKATRRLGTFDLAGCDIYTSCEPCPMCLAPSIGRISTASSTATTARMLPPSVSTTTSSIRR